MNQEVAKQLFLQGGTLIFENVPPGTEFGVDMQSWNTGKRFRGVKMIPPGLHFIYYSAVSKEGHTAPRTGFFYNFKRYEILVKKYDPQLEDIVDTNITEAETESFRRSLRDIEPFLGPYPYDVYKDWVSLTNHITNKVFRELEPLNGRISSVSELVSEPAIESRDTTCPPPSQRTRRSFNKMDVYEGLLPKMSIRAGTEIRFTKFPEQNHPVGCSASEISKHNIDLTWTLEQMMNRWKDDDGAEDDAILGELQLAFVCFIVGQTFEAFEQWKRLLQLMCTCDDALAARPALFHGFISTLHFQLGHVPKDLFVDIVSNTNFLTTTLQVFFANLECAAEGSVPRELREKGAKFKAHLTRKFKWSFEGDPDDYAPVVVLT